MIRRESRARARALQLLYMREFQHEPIRELTDRLVMMGVPRDEALTAGSSLAAAVIDRLDELDREVGEVIEHWRPERVGLIERNILRIGLHELLTEHAPPRVVIDEALRLAHRFAGVKAPPFVNGVLDRLARRAGRL